VIKAAGTHNGRPMLLLGLSGENMTRLMADEPIRLDTGELPGLPAMVVVIVGGRTEDAILAQLRSVGLVPSEQATGDVDG
jgi:hypothetical protein